MLGQYFRRDEGPGPHAPGADHALPFRKKVGQNPGITDRDRRFGVGYAKGNRFTLPAHQAAFLDKAAHPEHLGLRRVLLGHLGGRAKKVYPVAQTIAYQRGRNSQRHGRRRNDLDTALFL
jgi:hypothetical protein